jgi:hypothetical protein
MILTADQISAVHSQLTQHRDVSPPRAVLLAVAVLMGEESPRALICESKSDESTTTWRVVGLLDSGCLFALEAVGDDSRWNFDSFKDVGGQVQVQLSTRIRSLSDVTSMSLTRAMSYDSRGTNTPWDVETAWEIYWRDGSPALVLPTRIDATSGELVAADTIVEQVRKALAAH